MKKVQKNRISYVIPKEKQKFFIMVRKTKQSQKTFWEILFWNEKKKL